MSYIARLREALLGEDDVEEAVWEQVRVLVVDDESMVAKMYEDWLDDAGFDVDVAYSGEEALAKLDGSFDVVLLDRRMPLLSGDEVLEVIRSEDVRMLAPDAFEDRDPYHITQEYEERDVEDVALETVKKLTREAVENIREVEAYPMVCVVTAVDPDFDIVDMEFDHYVVKNVDRNTLVEVVGTLASLNELRRGVRRYQSMRWKEILLGRSLPAPRLEEDEGYAELKDEMRRIEDEGGRRIQKIKRLGDG